MGPGELSRAGPRLSPSREDDRRDNGDATLGELAYWDGAWIDAHMMSVLADEWTAHRGRPGSAVPDA